MEKRSDVRVLEVLLHFIQLPGTSNNPFKMDGNGDFQPFPILKIWNHHPIDSQPFINGWPQGVPGGGLLEFNL